MKRFNLSFIFTTILAALAMNLAACQTSPMGRKQLIVIGDDQMNEMGVQAFQEMKSKEPAVQDAKTNAYVQCVATAITNALPEKRQWEVVVFKSDQVNAFALPGGKIGVYEGLLKVANNSSQLAAVIGHEVGHVLARHGSERLTSTFGANFGLAIAQAIFAKPGSKDYKMLLASLGVQGALLKFSRVQEAEADDIGLDLMSKAGFDPEQAIVLWKNMSKAGGAAPPEFLSDHPSNDSRIKDLQDRMGPALANYNANKNRPNCKP